MKRLGDLILPDAIQWSDEHAWAPVTQEGVRTLGGSVAYWSTPLTGGRPITLEAHREVVWLTRAMVDALQAIAALPDAVFMLIWWDKSFQVRFRHQEPPAIDLRPCVPHNDRTPVPTWNDRYSGTVKLIEV
ncbi:MAG: hypothetical protein HQL66_00735 [Magnetococcales bacterium]|nr:hypothetical protein [Magnetococcales bacterium]